MVTGNTASRASLLILMALALGACSSGPRVTTLQPALESPEAPYQRILVVALFESLDARRELEREIVKELSARGVEAAAMMIVRDRHTPLSRDSVLQAVDKTGADAILVTQLISLDTNSKVKDRSPEATYNFRPTYYYNVFSVELTEYVEPQTVEFSHNLALQTELFAAANQERVWAIATERKIKESLEDYRDYSVFFEDNKAIVAELARANLIAR